MGLPMERAIHGAPNSSTTLPAAPTIVNIFKQICSICKMRHAAASPVSLLLSSAISMELAIGSPAVASTLISAYHSYAALKYPMPTDPRQCSMGIFYNKPTIFTRAVESVKIMTPEKKVFLFLFVFRISWLSIMSTYHSLIEITTNNLSCFKLQALDIDRSICAVFVKYTSVTHGK